MGRAAFAFLTGVVLLLALIGGTLVELLSGTELSFKLWTIVAAAETIAWRAKWTLLPAAILSSYAGLRYALRQRVAPGEPLPGGRRFARSGVLMSASVACLVAILIGVTIPERLRQREIAKQAAEASLKYAVQAAFMRYQNRFDKVPEELTQLSQLPDDDGTIAFVLANFDESAYTPSSMQAVTRSPKSRGRKNKTTSNSIVSLRSAAYRTNSNDSSTTAGVTYTNYDLVWYGHDKIPGTDDDRIIRDGEFVKPRARQTPTPSALATPSGAPANASKRSRGNR